ncbi:J domain-containing protein [Dyella sp. EPa41]|uniref:J domain-containing protein n=1 Tax=Dyella sp. EPa41 TaxID=1561194 RepID=UPI0019167289|nr:J domain-containing protein [Dyella sp. EPa41]
MAVTHETDFLDLYRQLGLNPGCELAELKQAYRRRVAMLHPDRRADRPADVRASARLQRLTAQYGAAMEFHRRHGRLPGSPAPVRGSQPSRAPLRVDVIADPFAASAMPREASASHHVTHVIAPKRRPRGRLAMLLALVAMGALVWSVYSIYGQQASADASDEASAPMQARAGDDGHSADAPALRLGMSADEVRAVEGDPVSMHGDLWEYGPSWVRFDQDRVVDWHSSPLRALHTGEKPVQGSR